MPESSRDYAPPAGGPAPYLTARRLAILWVALALAAASVYSVLLVARRVIIAEIGDKAATAAAVTAMVVKPEDLAAAGDSTATTGTARTAEVLKRSLLMHRDLSRVFVMRRPAWTTGDTWEIVADTEVTTTTGVDQEIYRGLPPEKLAQALKGPVMVVQSRHSVRTGTMLTALAPVTDSETSEPLALLAVEVSRNTVTGRYRGLNAVALAALGVLVSIIVLAFRAVTSRARALEAIRSLEGQVKRRNDELREANNRLHDTVIALQERERAMEQDFALAREVQQRLLPESFPFQGRMSFASYYEPCTIIGGDLFDAFPAGERLVGFYVADASGHGVSAALATATLKATAENSRRLITEDAYSEISRTRFGDMQSLDQRVSNFLSDLNRGLSLACRRGSFVTFVVCVLDLDTGDLVIGNAGHNPPIHCSGQDAREIEVPSNLAMGLIDTFAYETVRTRISVGDKIILYTDGIAERRNRAEDELGIEHLMEIVCASTRLGPETLITAIRNKVEEFAEGESAHDDQSMLIAEYRSTEPYQTKS